MSFDLDVQGSAAWRAVASATRSALAHCNSKEGKRPRFVRPWPARGLGTWRVCACAPPSTALPIDEPRRGGRRGAGPGRGPATLAFDGRNCPQRNSRFRPLLPFVFLLLQRLLHRWRPPRDSRPPPGRAPFALGQRHIAPWPGFNSALLCTARVGDGYL